MRTFGQGVRSFFSDLLGKEPVNQDREELRELQARVERARHFQNLMNHPGYKLFMEDMDVHMAALQSALEDARDMSEVHRCQVAIRELRVLMAYVPQQVESGEGDLQRLKELTALANATETASNG